MFLNFLTQAFRLNGRRAVRMRRERGLRVEWLEGRDLPACLVPDNTCFAVIGDYGLAGPNEQAVADLVKSWNPDFIITVGDNNYYNGAASTIDRNIGQYFHEFINPYTGSYGAGASTNRFFPSLGNHDWIPTGALPYLNYFTLPDNERYYDFTQGSVEFFAVDSDDHEPDGNHSTSIQANWLQSELAASTATWKIVYFHHAPYSSGSAHGSTAELQWPFQEWGASAVLSGHDHVYERVIRNGFPYFVNGLGGGEIKGFGTPITGSQVRYNSDFGAMLVDANESQITFQFIARTGAVIDTYAITLAGGPPTVTISASDPTATEPGTTNHGELTVSRTGVVNQALTVNYTVGGTASPGIDYTALSGSVTIPQGSASAKIVVTAKDDTTEEVMETVIATLSPSSSYTRGATMTATVNIVDNDPAPTLPVVSISATDSSASEPGSNTGKLTVSRTGGTDNSLTVNYTVTGTASPGGDYTALSGSVTIPSGSASANITVTPRDDSLVEGTETVIATLSTNSSYTRGTPTSATVNISDNDSSTLPVVTISATDSSASEPGSNKGKFKISRTGSTGAAVTVNYTIGGAAAAGADYAALSGTVTIPANSASVSIVVTALNDNRNEPVETVIATLASNSSYSAGSPNSATVNIYDNDPKLLAFGSGWRYLDNGSNQGTDWRGLNFSDSTWRWGSAQFGYGDGDETTVVSFGPDAGNRFVTTYFRRTFSVADASLYTSLTVRLLRDDGAVVYLNGTQVFLSNMPGGTITYTTLASSSVGAANENTMYETSIAASLLRTGTNVIAVEVHQFNATSSDISFDLELVASA
jgi:hypothetical protein